MTATINLVPMTPQEYERKHLQEVHDDLGNDPFLAYERLRLRQRIECLTAAIEGLKDPTQ